MIGQYLQYYCLCSFVGVGVFGRFGAGIEKQRWLRDQERRGGRRCEDGSSISTVDDDGGGGDGCSMTAVGDDEWGVKMDP